MWPEYRHRPVAGEPLARVVASTDRGVGTWDRSSPGQVKKGKENGWRPRDEEEIVARRMR
jgi:hypothetical protein